MRFSLRDDAVSEYLALASKYLDALQSENRKLNQTFNEMMVQSKYVKLQDTLHGILTRYNDVMSSDIKQIAVKDWMASDNSLHKLIDFYQCGDLAIAKAKSIELKVQNIVSEKLKIDISTYTKSESPIIKDDDFNKLQDSIKKFKENSSALSTKALNNIMTASSNNDIMQTLTGLVGEISKKTEEFGTYAMGTLNKLHDEVQSNAKAVERTTQEVVDSTRASFEQSRVSAGTQGSSSRSRVNSFTQGGHSGTGSNSNTVRTSEVEGNMDSAESNLQSEANQSNTSDGITQEYRDKTDRIISENLTDENIAKIIELMERIISEVGTDRFNSILDRNGSILRASANGSNKTNNKPKNKSKKQKESNKYGRYYVTDQSIALMSPIVYQTHIVIEPLDTFYKNKFKEIEDKTAFKCVEKFLGFTASTFQKLGFVGWDISKDSEEQTQPIPLNLGLYALTLGPEAVMTGQLLYSGNKALNEALPKIRENKTISKIRASVWDHARFLMKEPPGDNYIKQYLFEHYQIKYGDKYIEKCGGFNYYHKIIKKVDNEHRRDLENALFSSERYLLSKFNFRGWGTEYKYDNSVLGVFLNTIRSSLVDVPDIDIETGNKLTDFVYETYTKELKLKPDLRIDPVTLRRVEKQQDEE